MKRKATSYNNEYEIPLTATSKFCILLMATSHVRETLAPILRRHTTMTEQEIINAISKFEGLGGMTVNERLYVYGLIEEFDGALINDKDKTKKILEFLAFDKPSIKKIAAA